MPLRPPGLLMKFSNFIFFDDNLLFIRRVARKTASHREFHVESCPISHSAAHEKPFRFTLPSLLKNCAAQLDLDHGKRLHACIFQLGLQCDTFIASSLINLYVKCGFLSDANQVFSRLPERDATLWNTLLSGYFQYRHCHEGLCLLSEMQFSGIRPDAHSLSILLSACSSGCLSLEHGEQIHAYMFRNLMHGDTFLSTALVDMYAKCGKVMEAYGVFVLAVGKNVFTWNVMLGGFWQNGLWEKSLEFFVLMMNEDFELPSTTLSSVLVACSIGEAVDFGEAIHCCVIKAGLGLDHYVCTSLLAMYAKCMLINGARQVFDGVPDKGIELWNSMVSAYLGNNCAHDALDVYNQIKSSGLTPDCITISNMLSACSMTGDYDFGRKIHGELIKRPELSNMVVQSSLMTMYMKCGDTEAANNVFSSSEEWDVVVWGSMIAGFCHNEKFDRALDLFNHLRAKGLKPDSAVITSVTSTCGELEDVELGYEIHGNAIKSGTAADVFVGSSLIDMYAKLGLPHSARNVFDSMPCKNLVVWNSMISGYSRNGLLDEAVGVFAQIPQHGLVPDSISITSLLASVSSLAALAKGKMIHGYQLRNQIISDLHVENALLDMYMKCGCLSCAQEIFTRMTQRNLVAWNTMISGFGSHGHCLKAIMLFEEMQRSNVLPDDSTFLSLISSCSHSGLVEEGLKLFDCMREDYGILPRMEHYVNIVDLLSRAGRLNEAYDFVQGMPIKPDEGVWLCLLSACRVYRYRRLGEAVADHILELKPEGSGTYTQLLNFCGEMGLLDKAASVRLQMKEIGVKKNPGCSWIEVKDRVEVFYSGASSSPLHVEIYDTLVSLKRIMRDDKYSRDFLDWEFFP